MALVAQNADGRPHFAYYYKQGELSFVWDGNLEHSIEVCPGGYGEPVDDHIELSRSPMPKMFPHQWLEWFAQVCDTYIQKRTLGELNG